MGQRVDFGVKAVVFSVLVSGLTAQVLAESRPEVLERIKPVGQVAIEGGAVDQPAAEATPAPAAQPEAAPAPVQAAQPEAAPEAAPAQAEAAPEPAPVVAATSGGGDGAALYQAKTCMACHGADANTPIMPAYPRLAGQNAAYLEAQMKDIKSGTRNHGQTMLMKGIMAGVSDAEIAAIADWISKQ